MQRAVTTQATTWGPFLLQKQIVKSLPTLGSFSIQAYCLGTPSPIPPSPPRLLLSLNYTALGWEMEIFTLPLHHSKGGAAANVVFKRALLLVWKK